MTIDFKQATMVVQGGFIPEAFWSYCLIENKQIFYPFEVCNGACAARELVHKARSQGDFSQHIDYIYDQDGYFYCSYCKKILFRTFAQTLVQCPDCKRYFKGPKRNFPIDYECVDCE